MLTFKKKEKKVLVGIETYMAKASECLAGTNRTLQAYLAGEREQLQQHWEEVSQLESEADHLLLDVRELLFSGAYLPLVREDIHNLMERLDRVVNSAEACCKFFTAQRPEIPDAMAPSYSEVAETSFSIMTPLEKAVKQFLRRKGSMKDIRKYSAGVRDIEKAVDGMEYKIILQLTEQRGEDLAQFLHLKQALGHITEVSDRTEDVSDHLELAAMKMVV